MTIADRIREDTFENTTFNYVKGLWEQGFKADVIATTFKFPLQKVDEIIQKIKTSYN
jgi:hypothetical protein